MMAPWIIAGLLACAGTPWPEKTPAEVGLDPQKLASLREFAGGRGCVIRHGALVYSWGDIAKRADVASAAKPVYAHFLWKAIEDGKIAGIDDKVVRFEPRLAELNPDLGHKDREIAWRHLATQTSCYGVRERPGTAFDYNDWQMALFWDLLFRKVYGATPETVDAKILRPLLADRIGCEDEPTMIAFGPGDRAGRLGISVRDFARFGLLYLNGGTWGGERLISGENARVAVTSPLPNAIPRTKGEEAALIPGQRTMGSRRIPDDQCDHIGSYSFLWWTNGVDREGRRHWPDAPVDAYGAFGHGGLRAMVVIPSLDLILSWNDTGIDSRRKENEALHRLVAAVVDRGEAAAVWPEPDWPRAAPAEVGLDPARLAQAREYALRGEGSGLIVRAGKAAMAWGDLRARYDLKSTTKSIGAIALGIALADGKVKGLEDEASAYHPSLGIPPEENAKTGWIGKITLFHLATQTAGFEKPGGYERLIFEPGTKWSYSDGGPNWLAECLTFAYRRDIRDLLFERVFAPIGIGPEDLAWRTNAYRPKEIDGIPRREFGSGVSANVDAMARIGYLHLRRGRWRGTRILPEDFIDAARATPAAIRGLPVVGPETYGKASGHYGLLWWNNGDGTLAGVPRDAYWSWGLYESLIVVIPSLDIVVARAGKSIPRPAGGSHYGVLAPFLEPIAAAVTSENRVPPPAPPGRAPSPAPRP
ncbi:MAG: serine hydrolase [Planctomycetes bacterium]|nr:serine hydrolase [Planctomycetota bacterium]